LPENPQLERPQAQALAAARPHLSVQIGHRIGMLEIDVNFKLTKPWTILFGPSGSGKTTILRAIAGLLRPDRARIVHWPRAESDSAFTLIDTTSGMRSPSHIRGTPLAAQRATLFPHLRVRENLQYGCPGGMQGDRGESLPRLFHIDGLLEKRPAELSGGEGQRVSLARAAMAERKRILLLDEPFTGLDLPLRDSLLANLLVWQEKSGTPILSVTHDVGEAFQVGAEVIKLADGRVVEQGPVEVVLADERAQLLRQLNGAAGSPA
jgi:molybdate transport system ATP-binding protein